MGQRREKAEGFELSGLVSLLLILSVGVLRRRGLVF